MSKQLHWDTICERSRDLWTIRKRLASKLRSRRAIPNTDNAFDAIVASKLDHEIEILKWVLNHD